jgi:heme exporter protein D
MPDLGPHAVFIVWAYAGVALGVVLLIVLAILDARRTAARLRQLEARGIRRRSADRTP